MSSSVDLTPVLELERKAAALMNKGIKLRAAAKYGRAVEAARALGPDNLVAAWLLIRQGHALGSCAVDAVANGAEFGDFVVHRNDSIALLLGAVATLERRHVAGTLLEGKCTAVEEAWYAELIACRKMPPVLARLGKQLVGHHVFIGAATCALNVLLCADQFVAACSHAFQPLAENIAHAADLLQQQIHIRLELVTELEFTSLLRSILNIESAASARGAPVGAFGGLDTRLVQLLEGAWQRLLRSGVVEALCDEDAHIVTDADASRALDEALERSQTTAHLRRCALPGCGAREARPAHFKSCAACRAVVYCCRQHQVEGWASHKKACKAARKLAAADEGGPSGV